MMLMMLMICSDSASGYSEFLRKKLLMRSSNQAWFYHSAYVNQKGFYSIVMQDAVDCKYLFRDDVVGWPGSVHDARMVRHQAPVLGDPAYPRKVTQSAIRQLGGSSQLLITLSSLPPIRVKKNHCTTQHFI